MSSTREQIIALLASQSDAFVSGQWLSDQLKISRTAIWKQIKQLEEDGYQFESIPNKGYRLIHQPDKVSENTIYWGLATKWLGKRIEHYQLIESTQTLALKRAQEGCKQGLVIISDKQSAGQGRRMREWYSNNDDGIWLSFVIRPNLVPAQAPQLTLLTAIVLVKVIEATTGLKPKIKWPNDVLIGKKKVAGILTQAQGEHDHIHFAVIGIGLNVNQTDFKLSEMKSYQATSLKIETNQTFLKTKLIQLILSHFEAMYQTYITKGFDPIKQKWLESAYRLGDRLYYKVNGVEKTGVFVDLSDDGCLIVEDGQQKRKKLYSADINWF